MGLEKWYVGVGREEYIQGGPMWDHGHTETHWETIGPFDTFQALENACIKIMFDGVIFGKPFTKVPAPTGPMRY